jgi:serine/threonine-protein kinase
MVGSRLRQYVVASKLGEGGMGVVWRARDTMLERDVALKLLPADATRDEARRERFVREARAASGLNHPNIITVYEINSDNGIDFIAMELVEGETLSTRLARGPLPIDEALSIARQAADAVARAHRAGIVHRDLKPGNVMINRDGLVKVLDFGLAKTAESHAVGDPSDEVTRLALTRAGTALGTMGYMSPEQALGEAADARSDVFSFGVMLYEMLAGALPFRGHTSTELLRALHFAEPEPLEQVRSDVPPWVIPIVAKALAKDPKGRFPAMDAVAEALRGSVGVPATEKPPAASVASVAADPREGVRRHTLRPSWSAVAIVSTLVFSAWALVPWGRIATRTSNGQAASGSASRTALTREAAALLARDDRDGNIDRAIALLEQAVTADNRSAAVHAQLADAYRRKHRNAPDAQWLKLARESALRAVELNGDLASARTALGWVSLADGKRDESLREFGRAAELDPINAVPHLGLAMTYAAASDSRNAQAAYARAIELAPDDWRLHHEQADYAYRQARYADAAAGWETVRRLTPDNVLALRNLSAAYFYLGRHDEAASTLQRALEVQETPATYTNLGTIRFFQGKYTDAVAAFEKAVELGATRHVNWANLGDGYRWAPGRRAEAPAAYRRASELIAEQIAQRPDDADLRTRQAMYLVKMGEVPAALREVQHVVDRAPLSAQQLYRLVIVYELAADRPRALAMLELALQAGYPAGELKNEPEFTSLRSDARYQRLIARF